MPRRTSPTVSRRRLARRLKQIREDAGYTLEEAAALLDKTRSALSRIERGDTRADVHLVRSAMDVYDIYDGELLVLAREAAEVGWWRAYGLADFGYVDVETEASVVREYAGLNIPGLLQTEEYIRALLRTGLRRTAEEFENQVRVRLIRQERLTDDEFPLCLHAFIDEAALARVVGGRSVMLGQLRHLLAMRELPTVTIQVLPFDSGAHDAMQGPFTVLEFSRDDEPDLLYIAYPAGAQHIEKVEEVQTATLVLDRLRTQALSEDDSAVLIERLLADYR